MKKYISKAILPIALAFAGFTSCSEDLMDDINKNKDNILDAPAAFMIPDVLLRTSQNVVGGDINTYTSVIVEQNAACYGQLYNCDRREGSDIYGSTVYNNIWGGIYRNINNARIIIKKSENDPLCKGVGEVLLALNGAIATDIFGDTPWSQACDIDNYPSPALDKQEAIYADIMKTLDDAIADLSNVKSNTLAGKDFIYAGDAASWLKTAYALKARYTMRLAFRNGNYSSTDMQKVIDYVDKSYTSISDNCSLFYDGYEATSMNPFFDFFISREYLGYSKSLLDKLMAREDPRADKEAFEGYDWCYVGLDYMLENELACPNGTADEVQEAYAITSFMCADKAPVHFASYHEVLFLKAEALVRMNKTEDAKKVLKDAYLAGIENAEQSYYLIGCQYCDNSGADPIDMAAAGDTFDAKVAPLFDANPLQEVMIEKYIAMWGANGESIETYADVRRMIADLGSVDKMIAFYGLQNPNNKGKYSFSENAFPLRGPYGSGDVTTNPNIQEAYGNGQYVLTENVWWAGGNR